MEKYKTYAKLDKLRTYTELNQYGEAMGILQTIDVNKIKKYDDLMVIVDVYIKNNKFIEAKKLLENIYKKSPTRKVISKLIYCSINVDNFVDAERYYNEYAKQAANDVSVYIYRYKIDKAKKKDYDTLIDSLEKLKERDYMEEWAYELAKYYHKAGYKDKCIKECNNIMMWFSEGTVVEKAKLLKEYHVNGELVLGSTTNEKEEDFSATTKLEEITKEVKKHVKKNISEIDEDSALDMILDDIQVGDEKKSDNGNVDAFSTIIGESTDNSIKDNIVIDNDEDIEEIANIDNNEENVVLEEHIEERNEAQEDIMDDTTEDMADDENQEQVDIEQVEVNAEVSDESKEEKEDLKVINTETGRMINSDNIELDDELDGILKENMKDMEELGDGLDVFFNMNNDVDMVSSEDVVQSLTVSERKEKTNTKKKRQREKVEKVQVNEDVKEDSLETIEDNLEIESKVEEKLEVENITKLDKEEIETKTDKNNFEVETKNVENTQENKVEAETDDKTDLVEEEDETSGKIDEAEEITDDQDIQNEDSHEKKDTVNDNVYDNIFNALSNSVSKIVDEVIEEYKGNSDSDSISKELRDVKKAINKVARASQNYEEVAYTETFDKLAKANLDYIELDSNIFCNYYDIEILNYGIRKGIYNLQTSMVKGNFIISGPALSGRTTLARMIARQLYDMGYIKTKKIARISGDIFNKVDLNDKSSKLLDGCVIIQKAENVSREAYDNLLELISYFPGRLIVFLETTEVDKLFEINEDIKEFFGSVIEMPKFEMDDLIGFAHSYAAAEEFYISEEAETAIRKILSSRFRNSLKAYDFRHVIKIIDDAIDTIDSRELYELDYHEDSVRVIEKDDILNN